MQLSIAPTAGTALLSLRQDEESVILCAEIDGTSHDLLSVHENHRGELAVRLDPGTVQSRS